MEILPYDIQWSIWRSYWKNIIVPELIDSASFTWKGASDELRTLCKDKGCIQHGYHCLEDMIEDHNRWALDTCVGIKCANCEAYGFPCDNLAVYGFEDETMSRQWDANFDF